MNEGECVLINDKKAATNTSTGYIIVFSFPLYPSRNIGVASNEGNGSKGSLMHILRGIGGSCENQINCPILICFTDFKAEWIFHIIELPFF